MLVCGLTSSSRAVGSGSTYTVLREGLWLIVNPVIAGLALPLVMGFFLIVGGIVAMWQSVQIKKLQEHEL